MACDLHCKSKLCCKNACKNMFIYVYVLLECVAFIMGGNEAQIT